MTIQDRFNKYVYPEPNTGCFVWGGYITENGYGKFMVNGRSKFAHRVSFQLYKGVIPEKALICHRCDNRHCVNPDHLFTGTHKENTLDMFQKGRNADVRGEKNGRSKLSIEEIDDIRKEFKTGATERQIAKKYGISRGHSHRIKANKAWL